MVDDDTSTRAGSTDHDVFSDFAGVRVGSAGVGGTAVDFAGVRIGTVDTDGSVVDFAGVRIGHVAQRA